MYSFRGLLTYSRLSFVIKVPIELQNRPYNARNIPIKIFDGECPITFASRRRKGQKGLPRRAFRQVLSMLRTLCRELPLTLCRYRHGATGLCSLKACDFTCQIQESPSRKQSREEQSRAEQKGDNNTGIASSKSLHALCNSSDLSPMPGTGQIERVKQSKPSHHAFLGESVDNRNRTFICLQRLQWRRGFCVDTPVRANTPRERKALWGKHKYFGEYNGEFTNNYPEGDVPLFARFLPLVYTLRLLDTLPKMFISVCTNLSSFDIKTELANRYRNI